MTTWTIYAKRSKIPKLNFKGIERNRRRTVIKKWLIRTARKLIL